jgi:hypothetical protein
MQNLFKHVIKSPELNKARVIQKECNEILYSYKNNKVVVETENVVLNIYFWDKEDKLHQAIMNCHYSKSPQDWKPEMITAVKLAKLWK